MRCRWLLLASSLASLLASCMGDDPNAVPSTSDPDGGTNEGGPASNVALAIVSVEPLSAAPGRVLKSTIVIERKNGLVGPVRVTIGGVPNGVDAPGFDIPDGASTGEISVTGASAALPARTTVAVEVTLGVATARLDVPLVVRGVPGSPDTTRSPSGRHNLSFIPSAAAQDGRGRIWVAGAQSSLDTCEIERHLPTGEIDASFGSAGVLKLPVAPGSRIHCHAFAFQGDKLVIAGSEVAPDAGTSGLGLVMRLDEDGKPDPTFAEAGGRRFNGGAGNGVAIDSQGGIRVGASLGAEGQPFLVRFDANGNHVGTSELLDLGEIDDQTWVFRPDGTARVACMKYIEEADDAVGLAGFDANGGIDGTFGKTGSNAPVFRSKAADSFQGALALDAQGRVVVGARSPEDLGTKKGAHLMRFDADKPAPERWEKLYGSAYSPPTGYSEAIFSGLTVGADGKILAVGQHSNPATPSELFVSRFENNGAPDLTFAPTGVVVHAGLSGYPRSLLVQPDGAIIVLDRAAPGVASILRIWL